MTNIFKIVFFGIGIMGVAYLGYNVLLDAFGCENSLSSTTIFSHPLFVLSTASVCIVLANILSRMEAKAALTPTQNTEGVIAVSAKELNERLSQMDSRMDDFEVELVEQKQEGIATRVLLTQILSDEPERGLPEFTQENATQIDFYPILPNEKAINLATGRTEIVAKRNH